MRWSDWGVAPLLNEARQTGDRHGNGRDIGDQEDHKNLDRKEWQDGARDGFHLFAGHGTGHE